MGYVGTAPLSGDYRKLDDISGSFNGSTTGFTLQVGSVNVTPPKETTVLISVGGILQEPVSAYTISGSTITFTAAPASGADFFGVMLGDTMSIGTPSDDTVTGAKIADDAIDSEHYTDGSIDTAHLAADAVTGAKIADNAIDSEHYTDGSIDNAHIADDAIDSEHYAAASIDFAHIQNVAANSILGRNANDSGVLSEIALATTTILIGDGTGFTAAALSGDATMTNAGVVSITAAQTGITSVYNTSLKMGRDSQNLIDFATTDNKIILRVNNVDEVELVENALSPVTASGVDLGTTSLEWGNIYIGDDKKVFFGDGQDASIEYDEDGTDQLRITGNTIFENQVQYDKDILLDSTPADTVYSGITASFTAGEDLEVGEVVYLKASDSRVWKAVSVVSGTGLISAEIMCMGMVAVAASAGAAITILLQGFLQSTASFPTYAVGETLYVPEAEVGSKNVPEGVSPDTDGDFVQVVGWAAGADTVYFNPDFTIIEHA